MLDKKASWVCYCFEEMENSPWFQLRNRRRHQKTSPWVCRRIKNEFFTLNFHSKMPWKVLIKFHLSSFLSKRIQRSFPEKTFCHSFIHHLSVYRECYIFEQKKNWKTNKKTTTVHTWMRQLSNIREKLSKRKQKK